MRMVFKILLALVWLILFLLKWTSLIATDIASVVLRVVGMPLLLIGVAYLVLGFEPFLTIRVFAVGIGARTKAVRALSSGLVFLQRMTHVFCRINSIAAWPFLWFDLILYEFYHSFKCISCYIIYSL